MKSEGEIRKRIADLKTCRASPCGCAGTSHALKCTIGGRMMDAAISELLWAVGDNPSVDTLVEEMSADAARLRAERAAP